MPPSLRLVRPPKALHIALGIEVTCSMHQVLVYAPERIYDGSTLLARGIYEGFFKPDISCRLCIIETDLYPGEVAERMNKRFDATPPLGEMDVIAEVKIRPGMTERLWLNLRHHAEHWQMFEERARLSA